MSTFAGPGAPASSRLRASIVALVTPARRRAIRDGFTLVGLLGIVEQFVQTILSGGGPDQPAYWGFHLDTLYRGSALGGQAARLYSPAFFQLVAPLSNLPYAWFVALWAAGVGVTALVGYAIKLWLR